MTEKDKAALKPCPFCKKPPELSAFKSFAFGDQWQVDCKTHTCIEVSTGCRNSEAKAIDAWNTRATLTPAVVEPVSGAVPDGYIYEYDGQPGCGVHRSLKNEFWNGQYADRSIPYYIAAPEPEKAQGDELGFTAIMEKYPELKKWISKLSQVRMEISTIEWSAFCNVIQATINSALTERREPPADLSIGKQAEQIYEWCACDETGLCKYHGSDPLAGTPDGVCS